MWYFGEDTTPTTRARVSKKGSWEAGVDGALPGIVMQADPTVSGTGYRQEYLAGAAEDMGQVIADSGSVTVPFGTFDDIIRTRDWTPLEPDIVEEKIVRPLGRCRPRGDREPGRRTRRGRARGVHAAGDSISDRRRVCGPAPRRAANAIVIVVSSSAATRRKWRRSIGVPTNT